MRATVSTSNPPVPPVSPRPPQPLFRPVSQFRHLTPTSSRPVAGSIPAHVNSRLPHTHSLFSLSVNRHDNLNPPNSGLFHCSLFCFVLSLPLCFSLFFSFSLFFFHPSSLFCVSFFVPPPNQSNQSNQSITSQSIIVRCCALRIPTSLETAVPGPVPPLTTFPGPSQSPPSLVLSPFCFFFVFSFILFLFLFTLNSRLVETCSSSLHFRLFDPSTLRTQPSLPSTTDRPTPSHVRLHFGRCSNLLPLSLNQFTTEPTPRQHSIISLSLHCLGPIVENGATRGQHQRPGFG